MSLGMGRELSQDAGQSSRVLAGGPTPLVANAL